MSDNPSIADDFFSICRRFLSKKKDIFFGSQHLQELMRMAILAIGLHHKEAADSHSKFLIDLVKMIKYTANDINPE